MTRLPAGCRVVASLGPPNSTAAGRGAYAIRALPDLCRRSLLRPALFLAGHLVLQRKRADCGTASPVIAALC
jgi:hypothetical protein